MRSQWVITWGFISALMFLQCMRRISCACDAFNKIQCLHKKQTWYLLLRNTRNCCITFIFTTVQTNFAVSVMKELQTEPGQMHHVYIDISLDQTSWILLALSWEGVKTLSFLFEYVLSITSKICNKQGNAYFFKYDCLTFYIFENLWFAIWLNDLFFT